MQSHSDQEEKIKKIKFEVLGILNSTDKSEPPTHIKIAGSIRRANAALSKNDYATCFGVLSALQQKYPGLTSGDEKAWDKVFADVPEKEKEVLKALIAKQNEIANKIQMSIDAEAKQPKENKKKKEGFFSRMFGAGDVSSATLFSGNNPSSVSQAANDEMVPDRPRQEKKTKQGGRVLIYQDTGKPLTYEEVGQLYDGVKKDKGFDLAKINPKFVPTSCIIRSNGYEVSFSNESGFLSINRHEFLNQKPDMSKAVGWKVHIGLDEEKPGNVAAGINIINDVLMRHQVSSWKTNMPYATRTNQTQQAGKQVTIYTELDPGKDWAPILKEIDQALNKAGIKPSPAKAQTEQRMGDSSFVTYRNDKSADPGRGYVAADETNNFNPSNAPDPFKDLLKASSAPIAKAK